jgi:hypothetical protein
VTHPIIRPSSLPALRKCPRYSPDQSTGEAQKSAGTRRHDALARYLADDPDWRLAIVEKDDDGAEIASKGPEWDVDGVEWAGEYIRAHAPMADHPLVIEQRRRTVLTDFVTLSGTPDVTCGDVLFDLKGRNIDSYAEQMDAYAVLMNRDVVECHVLYATDRRAETSHIVRAHALDRIEAIVARVNDPESRPSVCDYCAWCANRASCPAFASVGSQAAEQLGLKVPAGNIDDIRDAAGLGDLKRAAEAVAEWSKLANSHVREMAIKHGVVADGFRLAQRKGSPSITDAWAAIQASGLPIETVAPLVSISLPDLAKAYAEANSLKEKAARADLEQRLGDLIKRGSSIHYLTPKS